jgi:hypothetical protein
MIARVHQRVKTEEVAFKLGGASVKILAAESTSLFRQFHDGNERTHVPCEPGLVDLKVVVGNACPDPSPPAVVSACGHP